MERRKVFGCNGLEKLGTVLELGIITDKREGSNFIWDVKN